MEIDGSINLNNGSIDVPSLKLLECAGFDVHNGVQDKSVNNVHCQWPAIDANLSETRDGRYFCTCGNFVTDNRFDR